eukprot:TRINITY_DN10147_c0_g1_i1.p1 TRINITY_DN10147_c0_g1~~TRINITY_DN10147_c0_g1_i1.p1  ORF type:complete len:825 (-),score=192.23 TRINITY_DN10147_c0_g1_i1:886-3360(-)
MSIQSVAESSAMDCSGRQKIVPSRLTSRSKASAGAVEAAAAFLAELQAVRADLGHAGREAEAVPAIRAILSERRLVDDGHSSSRCLSAHSDKQGQRSEHPIPLLQPVTLWGSAWAGVRARGLKHIEDPLDDEEEDKKEEEAADDNDDNEEEVEAATDFGHAGSETENMPGGPVLAERRLADDSHSSTRSLSTTLHNKGQRSDPPDRFLEPIADWGSDRSGVCARGLQNLEDENDETFLAPEPDGDRLGPQGYDMEELLVAELDEPEEKLEETEIKTVRDTLHWGVNCGGNASIGAGRLAAGATAVHTRNGVLAASVPNVAVLTGVSHPQDTRCDGRWRQEERCTPDRQAKQRQDIPLSLLEGEEDSEVEDNEVEQVMLDDSELNDDDEEEEEEDKRAEQLLGDDFTEESEDQEEEEQQEDDEKDGDEEQGKDKKKVQEKDVQDRIEHMKCHEDKFRSRHIPAMQETECHEEQPCGEPSPTSESQRIHPQQRPPSCASPDSLSLACGEPSPSWESPRVHTQPQQQQQQQQHTSHARSGFLLLELQNESSGSEEQRDLLDCSKDDIIELGLACGFATKIAMVREERFLLEDAIRNHAESWDITTLRRDVTYSEKARNANNMNAFAKRYSEPEVQETQGSPVAAEVSDDRQDSEHEPSDCSEWFEASSESSEDDPQQESHIFTASVQLQVHKQRNELAEVEACTVEACTVQLQTGAVEVSQADTLLEGSFQAEELELSLHEAKQQAEEPELATLPEQCEVVTMRPAKLQQTCVYCNGPPKAVSPCWRRCASCLTRLFRCCPSAASCACCIQRRDWRSVEPCSGCGRI